MAIVNVNSNQSNVEKFSRKRQLTEQEEIIPNRKNRVKSKVVKVNASDARKVVQRQNNEYEEADTSQPDCDNVVQFQEDGEIIEMEIDDGGEAAKQFTSDDEASQSKAENESDVESGEISPTQLDLYQEEGNEIPTPSTSNKNKNKPRRESVEQRLDTMSSTLLAMKEIMEKSGILDAKDNSKGSQIQIQNKGKNNSDLLSDTTIYQAVLRQDGQVGCDETTTFDIQVDPEIVFKGKTGCKRCRYDYQFYRMQARHRRSL